MGISPLGAKFLNHPPKWAPTSTPFTYHSLENLIRFLAKTNVNLMGPPKIFNPWTGFWPNPMELPLN